VSSSLTNNERERLEAICKSAKVPVMHFEDTSVRLGHIAGIGYPAKVVSVKSAGDADLEKLLKLAKETGSSQKI
jgi:ribosomal protein L30E